MSSQPAAAESTPQHSPLPLLRTSIHLTTLVQSLTAFSFTTFLVLHLSAPLAAIFGGEEAANGVMLVGRELYQGDLTEQVLVYGSAVGHVLSGMVGRGLKTMERNVRRTRRRKEVKQVAEALAEAQGDELPSLGHERHPTVSTLLDVNTTLDSSSPLYASDSTLASSLPIAGSPSIHPPFTLHHITGYLLIIPLFQHLRLHRFLPMSHSLDSIFSYSFVSHSLRSSRYRLASILGYATLTGLTAYHTLVGVRVLWDPTAPRGLGGRRSEGRKGSPSSWQVAVAGLVAGVGLGAVRIATSGVNGPEWIGRKSDRALIVGWGF